MTIEEVCARQHETGNDELYLRLKGVFWMAYDGAAFAVARITGYEVKKLKTVNRYELGFSRAALDKVLRQMRDGGIAVDDYKEGDVLIRFSGGNTEVDDKLLGKHEAVKACDIGITKEEIDTLLNLCRKLLHIV